MQSNLQRRKFIAAVGGAALAALAQQAGEAVWGLGRAR
jgi:hypothetical protein